MVATRTKRQTSFLSSLTHPGIVPTRPASPQVRRNERAPELPPDPARLSATLRELAMRAHRAVRVAEGLGSSPGAAADSDRELSDLHGRIVQLERSLDAQSLGGLIPYVAALRQRVADSLRSHAAAPD